MPKVSQQALHRRQLPVCWNKTSPLAGQLDPENKTEGDDPYTSCQALENTCTLHVAGSSLATTNVQSGTRMSRRTTAYPRALGNTMQVANTKDEKKQSKPPPCEQGGLVAKLKTDWQ